MGVPSGYLFSLNTQVPFKIGRLFPSSVRGTSFLYMAVQVFCFTNCLISDFIGELQHKADTAQLDSPTRSRTSSRHSQGYARLGERSFLGSVISHTLQQACPPDRPTRSRTSLRHGHLGFSPRSRLCKAWCALISWNDDKLHSCLWRRIFCSRFDDFLASSRIQERQMSLLFQNPV